MLVSLHSVLWLGIEHPWAKPLILVHLGLFLLWQPLWRRETKLSRGNSIFILGVSLIALVWLNWWVLAFWVSGLFALVGGRAFNYYSRWQRAHLLLLMTYLLAVLWLYITPVLLNLPAFADVTGSILNIVLPLLLLAMFVLPLGSDSDNNVQAVDFIYVLLLFTLLTLVVLGSLAFMTLGHVSYLEALLRTLFMMGIALSILGVLWNPRMGFSGLQASFSRYVLSIGTPLEEWLKQLASTAQQEQDPSTFLERATSYLAEMPSISGLSWVSGEGHGTLGASSPHRIELFEDDLAVTLFTRQAISPTVILHMSLLVQLLGYFYQAKRREQRLREMTRQQTIYETGARLTHDLKNMLQSLFALTSVAQHDSVKAQPILKSQLPVLTQRIEVLLSKLKTPGEDKDEIERPLASWWESLRNRNQHRDIEWVFENGIHADSFAGVALPKAALTPAPLPKGEGLGRRDSGFSPSPIPHPMPSPEGRGSSHGIRVGESLLTESAKNGEQAPQHSHAANTQLIPASMFDCVLDNLLENANNKRLREPGIRITVRLSTDPLYVEVSDTGSAVPENITRSLLRTVVPSEDGLGVGLYQAARWAQQMGYKLTLRENHEGKVLFEMAPVK